MNELSQKYDFLLHPIKDLTKNWNVDIAAVLEDFREELDKMTFSFDGGMTKLNFAEAAFLIQGTACVWSRKVESLHALVYQTLEMIVSYRHNKQPTSIDPQGLDNDATFDDHEDKLILWMDTGQFLNKFCEFLVNFLNLDDIKSGLLKKISGIGADVVCLSQRCPFFQNLEENRGSPFSNPGGEISYYYKDFWTNNLFTQKRGIVLLECQLDDEAMPTCGNQQDCCANANAEDDALDNPADDFLEDIDDTVVAEVSCPKPEIPEEAVALENEEIHFNLRARNNPSLSNVKPVEPTQTATSCTLDPHTECRQWIAIPFKKGNTIRYPPSLNDNTRKRKKSQTSNDILCLSDYLASARQFVQADESNSIKQEKIRRQERWKKLKPLQAKEKLAPGTEYAHRTDNDLPEVYHEDAECDYDDDGDDVPDVDDLVNDVTSNTIPAMSDVNSSFDLAMDTYEDLVRHHVDLFYSSAKRSMQESVTSQRVKQWQETVEPFVAEQDSHPEFDIHKYGDSVLGRFDAVGETKSFACCVANESRWSTCRMFVAVLQLANDENLHLSTSNQNLERSINTLELKLLNRDKSRLRMDEQFALS